MIPVRDGDSSANQRDSQIRHYLTSAHPHFSLNLLSWAIIASEVAKQHSAPVSPSWTGAERILGTVTAIF